MQGFSLFSKNLGEDFLRNDKFFISTIMFLVLFGGIGFNVISQIQSKLLRWGNTTIKLTVSTKLSLITSSTLLVVGTLGYLILEQKFTLSNFSFFDQVFQSLFYSITTRTAGFNILDLSKMGSPVVFFSLFLMWVGASPNSTGGGVKTTTFALAFLQILNFVRGKSRLEVFHRNIAEVSVYRASATIVSISLCYFWIYFFTFTCRNITIFRYLF
jgi:trk system potassium uptake protein